MNDIRKKAKDYAKVKHKEEYNDPIYHRDVVETINDFEAGYKKALAISRVSHCACTPDETTGTTTIKCCNICGKPAESFWRCG